MSAPLLPPDDRQLFDVYIEEVTHWHYRIKARDRDRAESIGTDLLVLQGVRGAKRLDRIRYVYEVEPHEAGAS